MKSYLIIIISLIIFSCSKQILENQQPYTTYESENLVVIKLSENVYQHISFLQTHDFGKVSCNGMIVVDNGEAIVLDTPADAESSLELIKFLENRNIKINSVVATHFHVDCIGGLDEFHKIDVPSYANQMTIDLLKNETGNIPQTGFEKELVLNVGNKKVYVEYFGEGHTKDNVVAYFPDEKVLFGGCLIKETGAGKGNLEDANEKEWSKTVSKIKAKYPHIKTVIPGHGKRGGIELLDYTIRLFE